MFELLLIIFGIFGLVLGSLLVIENAKRIALILGVSEIIIGLTIISIGTSIPEITTNVFSALSNLKGVAASGIAVGTNIGSCLTQITLILGLTGLFGRLKTDRATLRTDGFMVLLAIILFFLAGLLFSKNGYFISRWEGAVLIITYLAYLVYTYKRHKQDSALRKRLKPVINHNHHDGIVLKFILLFAGLAVVLFSSDIIVKNAVHIANAWGVSQGFIGVMIIGVGTGLPELATAITAVLRKAKSISIGTLIGSNITDPLFSLGSGAIISGFSVSKTLLFFDIPFWFLATVVALIFFSTQDRTLTKSQAFSLLGIYILFVTLKIIFFI